MRWLPRGTHAWRKFVTPAELDYHFRGHGLRVVESCGVTLDVPSMQWRISRDHSATYLQFRRKV